MYTCTCYVCPNNVHSPPKKKKIQSFCSINWKFQLNVQRVLDAGVTAWHSKVMPGSHEWCKSKCKCKWKKWIFVHFLALVIAFLTSPVNQQKSANARLHFALHLHCLCEPGNNVFCMFLLTVSTSRMPRTLYILSPVTTSFIGISLPSYTDNNIMNEMCLKPCQKCSPLCFLSWAKSKCMQHCVN